MIEASRNMLRQKLRTSLTILGIVIGVFALTVMGAMAEKMNLLMAGGVQYYSGHVTIVSKSVSGFAGAPLNIGVARRLARVPGAAAAIPMVYVMLKGDQAASFGVPDMAIGYGPRLAKYEKFKIRAAQGVMPADGERGVALIGSSVAREYKIHVGQIFKVHGMPFLVKGIAETTMTGPDTTVMISLKDAQEMFWRQLPPMLQSGVNASTLASAINVYPKPGVNGDALAQRIKDAHISGIKVQSPTDIKKQFDQMSVIFNLIVMGSAIIALIVGSLSVINTMAMSVAERVKEIGLKKAIGAHTAHIMREYLTEAGIIGFLGGCTGLILGSILVHFINASTTSTQIFAITTRLAVGAVLFATVLGVVAGVLPALRAARLNPVDALRSE